MSRWGDSRLRGYSTPSESSRTRRLSRLSRADAAGLRENAAELAEGRLAQSPGLQERLTALADDPAARVRFQVALLSRCLER